MVPGAARNFHPAPRGKVLMLKGKTACKKDGRSKGTLAGAWNSYHGVT
jgi:hypothetical protein